jgi:uncharacterized RDD family membrane protein YckC
MATDLDSPHEGLRNEPSDAVEVEDSGYTYVEYAGFIRRLAAFFIDTVLFNACFVSLTFAFFYPLTILFPILADIPDRYWGYFQFGLGITLYWLYFACMESSAWHATFGKLLLKIEVIDLYGNYVGFWRATLRHFAKYMSALMMGVGFIIIDFTKQKQGIHDMVAHCLVVKRKREMAFEPTPAID